MRYQLTVAVCLVAVAAANVTTPFDLVFKAYKSCADGDTLSCLRKRTIQLVQRASREDRLPIVGDSLLIVRDPHANATIDHSIADRSLTDTVTNFLNTHRIQLKFPQLNFLQPDDEGRKKGNKYGGIGIMMGGMMMAMGMAALAALAGKALAASMAALMMAAMAAMRKGGGGGGHGGHSSYEVISIPSHHHRSFLSEQDDHHLGPYRYHEPVYENRK